LGVAFVPARFPGRREIGTAWVGHGPVGAVLSVFIGGKRGVFVAGRLPEMFSSRRDEINASLARLAARDVASLRAAA